MAILITGGAGYIGSHTALQMLLAGHDIVVLDNLSNSSAESLQRIKKIAAKDFVFIQADVRDQTTLRTVFARYDITAVLHFAGLKAVGESTERPQRYYDNNVVGSLRLIEVMMEFGVKTIVFSSSATVYGDPDVVPVKETSALSVASPYARTKLMVEDILRDIYQSDKTWRIALLRYFNPIGAHESGMIGENPQGTPNNLLPYVAQVAVGRLEKLRIFGNDYPTHDGTGVRDYIHVMDLADGHVAALHYLLKHPTLLTVNLGTGIGYSVLDVVNTFAKVSGQPIPYEFYPRRAGDVARYFADPQLAKQLLGWTVARNLEKMCLDMWNWQIKNPTGYDA